MTSVLAGVLRRDALATVVLRRGDSELSSWTLPCGERIDLAAVGHLARLALTARRLGCAIELRDADPALIGLLGFCGLAEVAGPRGSADRRELLSETRASSAAEPPRRDSTPERASRPQDL